MIENMAVINVYHDKTWEIVLSGVSHDEAMQRWTEIDDARLDGKTPDLAYTMVRHYSGEWRDLFVGAGYVQRIMPPPSERHWSTLPPVSKGFTRVPDRLVGGRGDPYPWQRMVKCDKCGEVIASQGIGYHNNREDHR
jgi:hypothetical protein